VTLPALRGDRDVGAGLGEHADRSQERLGDVDVQIVIAELPEEVAGRIVGLLPRRVRDGIRGPLQRTAPHRSRQLRPPRPDHPLADLSHKRIKRRPILGGLINGYERAA